MKIHPKHFFSPLIQISKNISTRKLTIVKLHESAKSASQRGMRATGRAMRVMRATVQMLRIFIVLFTFAWTIFFLCFFVSLFGENFVYSKSPKMRKKIKTIRKNLLRFKTSVKKKKKNPRETYGCTATQMVIH